MKKGIKIGVITLLLLLTGCTIGGSFFMLNYSLRPEAKIRAKNADSYPFMYKNYPFWLVAEPQCNKHVAGYLPDLKQKCPEVHEPD